MSFLTRLSFTYIYDNIFYFFYIPTSDVIFNTTFYGMVGAYIIMTRRNSYLKKKQ